MKKYILIFILFITSLLSETKNILILNSYSRDSKWTEKQLKGIENTMFDKDYKFYYEYLEYENFNNQDYLKKYKELLISKYKNINMDLVVTTDDYAYEYYKNNKDILKNNPFTIAAGVTKRIYASNTEYLLKQFDIEKNLELVEKQFKDEKTIKTIYLVVDNSIEGKSIEENLKKILKNYEYKYNFIWLSHNYTELKNQFKNLKKNSAIFHLLYFKDSDSTNADVIKDLYDGLDVPIYAFYDFYLLPKTNTLGGYVIDGEKFGEEIGKMIINYLSYKVINNQENSSSYSNYKFSLDIAEKLKVKYIPIKSEVYSKQIGYIKSRKYELLSILIILMISSILVYNGKKNYRAQKKINDQNKKIWGLNEELFKTQKEIIAALGQIIENRSKETANHTIRVAKISRLLGELLGFDEEEANSIEIASPLHDVGKIAIPDNVLEKTGKLEKEEFEIIKTHSKVGYSILKESNIPILKIAANIAHEHHERWDGSGYPRGISEEKISIYARITTAADIFDALLSKRVYKEPWSIEQVLQFFKDEKGRIFDPKITDVFLENADKIIAIRKEFED